MCPDLRDPVFIPVMIFADRMTQHLKKKWNSCTYNEKENTVIMEQRQR